MQQRPIKFRAWDTDKKVMNPYVTIIEGMVLLTPAKPENQIVMEFTGLLDKNGNEIYEGDIVRYEFTDTVEVGVVGWNAERARWGFTSSDGVNYGISQQDIVKRAEFIGNIHENPDLIESGAITPKK